MRRIARIAALLGPVLIALVMLSASTPASARALRAASEDIVMTVSSSPAMPRLAMPVRCWIHSSFVSRLAGISWLVISRTGRCSASPTIRL